MSIGRGSRARIENGISELLAIVLGVVITIAIGVMFYAFMPNFVTTLVQQQRIGVTQISSSVLNDGSAIISLSIKNLGTKAIKEINITALNFGVEAISPDRAKTYGINNNSISIGLHDSMISPGQELPVVLKIRSRVTTITSGTKVNLIIVAKFVDESTTSMTTSITVI